MELSNQQPVTTELLSPPDMERLIVRVDELLTESDLSSVRVLTGIDALNEESIEYLQQFDPILPDLTGALERHQQLIDTRSRVHKTKPLAIGVQGMRRVTDMLTNAPRLLTPGPEFKSVSRYVWAMNTSQWADVQIRELYFDGPLTVNGNVHIFDPSTSSIEVRVQGPGADWHEHTRGLAFQMNSGGDAAVSVYPIGDTLVAPYLSLEGGVHAALLSVLDQVDVAR